MPQPDLVIIGHAFAPFGFEAILRPLIPGW